MACQCNLVDWALNPLKVVLFFTFAAVSGLLPYLNIHMRHLGFTVHETAIICCLLPLSQILSFRVINSSIRKVGSHRSVLMHAIVFLLASVSLLLVFPVLPPPDHRHHSLHLMCGSDINPRIIVDKCGVSRKCNTVQSEDLINLQFTSCSVQCPNHGVDLQEPINVAELCFDELERGVCHVVEVNNTLSENFTFGLYLNSHEDRNTDCYYPVEAVTWHQSIYHHMSCPIIIPHFNKKNCSLKCRFQEVNDVTSTLSFDNEECVYIGYMRWVFFSLYLVLRWIIHLLVAVVLMLLENSLTTMTQVTNGRYTVVNIYNSIATAISPPVFGYVIDIKSTTVTDYNYSIYVFDILLGLVLIMIVILDVEIFPLPRNQLKYFRELSSQTEYILLLVVMFWMGVIWGHIETFLFWYLLEYDTPKYVLGLTITVGSLTGIPFLKKSILIVQKVGCVNILCFSLLMYCGRCIAYSLISDGWWSVLLATTDLLTYHLMSVASIQYCSYIVPNNILDSGAALMKVIHYSIGRAAGVIIGGGVMGVFGSHITFRVLGTSCGILGFLYLFIFYAFLYRKSLDESSENEMKSETQVWEITDATSERLLMQPTSQHSEAANEQPSTTRNSKLHNEQKAQVPNDKGCGSSRYNKSAINKGNVSFDKVVIVHETSNTS